ncbi:MAG TPA: hypothetical protein ENI87_12400 [bacterium]|nr:hypothetical protein [bacterium]
MRYALSICLALLAAWAFVWGLAEPAPPPPASDTPVDAPAAAPAKAAADAAGAESAATAPLRRAAARDRDGDATGLRPPLPQNARWVDVQIVDAHTQEPVPDAEVRWSNLVQRELVDRMPYRRRMQFLRDDIRIVDELGWRTRSDENGMVRVVPGPGLADVVARAGDRFGRDQFGSEPQDPVRGHRLEVRPDVTLRVRVRTADGKPASAVPVGFRGKPETADEAKWAYWLPVLQTDADGLATFRHVQNHRIYGSGFIARGPGTAWQVALRTPHVDCAPVDIAVAAPPREPIELHLPPTGHLRIRVLLNGHRAHLRSIMLREAPLQSQPFRVDTFTRDVGDDGWAVFSHLPLGETFYVGEWSWEQEVRGPSLAGETVSATVHLDQHLIVARGRVLRADGAPLGDENLSVSFRVDGERQSASLRTERDGTFTWVVSKARERTLRAEAVEFRWSAREREAETAVAGPFHLHNGDNELGDIRLTPSRVLVAGRLTFDRDVERSVWLHVERYEAAAGAEPAWRRVRDARVQIAADHTFAGYGAIEPGRYRLVVSSFDNLPVEPIEFVPGARDLVVSIACGDRIDVHATLPDGVLANDVYAQLVRTDAPGEPSEERQYDGERGHLGLRWRAVAPGTYAIDFFLAGAQPRLLRIDDVQVPPPPGQHERLTTLDLRDVIRPLHLHVRGADGRGPVLMFALPQRGETWRGKRLAEGEGIYALPAAATDLLVAGRRIVPHELHGVGDRAEVTLQPRPSASFTLVDAAAAHGVQLTVELRPQPAAPPDARRYREVWGEGALGPLLHPVPLTQPLRDGVADLPILPGSYRVQVGVGLPSGNTTTHLSDYSPRHIDGPGSFLLQCDAREIAAAIARLRSPRDDR